MGDPEDCGHVGGTQFQFSSHEDKTLSAELVNSSTNSHIARKSFECEASGSAHDFLTGSLVRFRLRG
jgi:hypothetical protein